MDSAVRKLLAFYYDSLLASEDGARTGADPEALHDMRVATRRMRAVLRVFGPYLEGKSGRELERGLRSLTRALGAVRDLDVLLENAEGFRDALPEGERPGLQALIDDWSGARKQERKKLNRVLDSKEYVRLRKRISGYLEKHEREQDRHSADIEPHEVRHVAASAVWEKYEAVRAFESVMAEPTTEQLHFLRIKSKYLRYTLESFRDVLPAQAESLVADVVAIQDMLGQLHDADVGAQMARAFRESKQRKEKKAKNDTRGGINLTGLDKYIEAREATARRLTEEFAPLWSRVSGPKWRESLADAIARV
jgi:CHAD domain-containing protein